MRRDRSVCLDCLCAAATAVSDQQQTQQHQDYEKRAEAIKDRLINQVRTSGNVPTSVESYIRFFNRKVTRNHGSYAFAERLDGWSNNFINGNAAIRIRGTNISVNSRRSIGVGDHPFDRGGRKGLPSTRYQHEIAS